MDPRRRTFPFGQGFVTYSSSEKEKAIFDLDDAYATVFFKLCLYSLICRTFFMIRRRVALSAFDRTTFFALVLFFLP